MSKTFFSFNTFVKCVFTGNCPISSVAHSNLIMYLLEILVSGPLPRPTKTQVDCDLPRYHTEIFKIDEFCQAPTRVICTSLVIIVTLIRNSKLLGTDINKEYKAEFMKKQIDFVQIEL